MPERDMVIFPDRQVLAKEALLPEPIFYPTTSEALEVLIFLLLMGI